MGELQNAEKIKELTSNRGWGDPADDPEDWKMDLEPEQRSVEVGDGNLPTPEQDPDEPTAPLDFLPEAGAAEDSEEAGEEASESEGETEPIVDERIAALEKEAAGRLNALIAERQRNAQIVNQLAELRDAFQQSQIQAEPVPEIPDPDIDGVGYLEATFDQKTGAVAQEVAAIRQTLEADRFQNDVVQVAQASAYHENEFAKEHADYEKAFELVQGHYVDAFRQEGLTDEMAKGKALMLGYATSKRALMSGQNPAEIIYNEAKRLGHVPPDPTPIPPVTEKTRAGAKRVSLSEPGMEGQGNAPGLRKGEVTRQWLFDNLDKAQRVELWKDRAFNEAMNNTGRATLPESFKV
jgi:hypothetical protein